MLWVFACLYVPFPFFVFMISYFLSRFFQSHIEKIVEKPASQSSLHAPLSRRQSHNVNVEDIIAQQVSDHRTMVPFSYMC